MREGDRVGGLSRRGTGSKWSAFALRSLLVSWTTEKGEILSRRFMLVSFVLLLVLPAAAVAQSADTPGIDIAAERTRWDSVHGEGMYEVAVAYQEYFREAFGLPQRPDVIHAALRREIAAESGPEKAALDELLGHYGLVLLPDEAAEMARREAAFEKIPELKDRSAEVVGDRFGGVWIETKTGRVVIGVAGDPSPSEVAGLRSVIPDVQIVEVEFGHAEMIRVYDELSRFSTKDNGIAVFVDTNRNRVVLEAPGAVFDLPGGIPSGIIEIRETVEHSLTGNPDSSHNSLTEVPGGLEISVNDTSSTSSGVEACSSNFTWKKYSTYYLGTAAHCFEDFTSPDYVRHPWNGTAIMSNNYATKLDTARVDFAAVPTWTDKYQNNYYHVMPPGHSVHDHQYTITGRQYLSQITEGQGVCASLPFSHTGTWSTSWYFCGSVFDYPYTVDGKSYQVLSTIPVHSGDSGTGTKWGHNAYGIMWKAKLAGWNTWFGIYSPVYYPVGWYGYTLVTSNPS